MSATAWDGWKRRRRRSGLAAACLLILAAHRSSAADAGVRALLFESLDAGPSVFVNTGVKVAADRIDREGIAGLGVIGGGLRTEREAASGSAAVTTRARATVLAGALGGYQLFRDWGVLGLFAGPEVAQETLIDVRGVRPLPARFGLRLQGELWARPSQDTLATATLILGSARWDAYGRVSAGYRVWGFYLGPELAAYADRTGYRRWSTGLHATEFRLGSFTFRLSGGCSYEVETRRAGPYVALAAWAPL